MKKIHITTLGCDKNTVDAQQMLGMLAENGYTIEPDPAQAEIIVVNTCCFIQAAKEESIEYILEYAGYKESGPCEILVVAGCMAERYHQELAEEMPEVDGFLGVGHIDNIIDLIKSVESGRGGETLAGDIDRPYLEEMPRYIEDNTITAYLKISEGCDHHCTYCVIPKIRGRHRSRQPEAIYREAAHLEEKGVRELIIIAQDITQYGNDLDEEIDLAGLLTRLSEDFSFHWIRLLYMYPEGITEALLDVIAGHENICHYFDIPIQHTEDKILKRMGRPVSKSHLFEQVGLIRKKLPDAVLRTAIITGFPGETEEDHEGLLASLRALKINRLGVFKYSQEEGTPAAAFPNQVDEAVMERRWNEIYGQQEEITAEANEAFVGKSLDVLIEEMEAPGTYSGRTYGDAPEIDCMVFANSGEEVLDIGNFYKVKIIQTLDYDLIGDVESELT
ncbi:30S ribosomal protein S12 methylthiotransferase RimO [Eubacterium sp. AM05-23]|uniref:30S ribosomal protein S12 methylthiotransferase RimO n=1 Tax=Eubacterium TaxID=1730 RepID=UPI000E50D6C6|nr:MULTISPECIES: 30S ribosomal protein S12 methylthiotransferase RimO [Eubacterium]RHO58763.1 30S ribosomal protein S12 methylthiotransferase RimO [Eubacterium sp. AM05-23]